jgi:hypothetical protein
MPRTCRGFVTCHGAVQPGRERPPGRPRGRVAGPGGGVAHAPVAIRTANCARHRTPRADVTFAPATRAQVQGIVEVASAVGHHCVLAIAQRAATGPTPRSGRMRPGSSSPCSSSHTTTISLARGRERLGPSSPSSSLSRPSPLHETHADQREKKTVAGARNGCLSGSSSPRSSSHSRATRQVPIR